MKNILTSFAIIIIFENIFFINGAVAFCTNQKDLKIISVIHAHKINSENRTFEDITLKDPLPLKISKDFAPTEITVECNPKHTHPKDKIMVRLNLLQDTGKLIQTNQFKGSCKDQLSLGSASQLQFYAKPQTAKAVFTLSLQNKVICTHEVKLYGAN